MKRKKDDLVQLKLRLPRTLAARIERLARERHHSINAMVFIIVEEWFRNASVQTAMEEGRNPSVQAAMEEARAAREARARVATLEDLNALRQEVWKKFGIAKGKSDEGTS